MCDALDTKTLDLMSGVFNKYLTVHKAVLSLTMNCKTRP